MSKDTIEIGGKEWIPVGNDNYHYENNVMIQEMIGPVSMYAVFDNGEKVSGTYGPLNQEDCISYAEGYADAKEKYE